MDRCAHILLRFVAVLLVCCASASLCHSATLLGQPVRPGATLDIKFPVSPHFQDYAAAGGNPRPTTGHALISFPKNFDPARTWPILIVISTADNRRTNLMD